MRLDILEEFASAQSWVHGEIAKAELRHACRLQEQRAGWEEARRLKLRTDANARARRQASLKKYEARRWEQTRADPAKRAAHNARRMANYRRSRALLRAELQRRAA